MRLKGGSVLLLLLWLVAAPGCQVNTEPQQPAKKPDPGGNTLVTEGRYPAEVRTWLANMRPFLVAGVIEKDNKTYLMINGGEQKTGGHRLQVARIQESDRRMTVTVDFEKPSGPAAQVISYPNTVYVLDRPLGRKEVVFLSSEGDEPIPRIVGCQPTMPFRAESDHIKIMSMERTGDRFSAHGIARVLAGSVSYRFTDSAGVSLSTGSVQAEAGAPDWGCFKLNQIKRPAGATHLQIYGLSSRDGQPDTVTVTL